MKRIYILPFFLILNAFLFAQPQEKQCGATAYTPEYLAAHPEEEEKLLESELLIQQWIAEHKDQALPREVITIPVVVHVVYREERFRFSDIEVQAQIDGLTADFRKLNNNASIIPEEFRSIAADVEFDFCLATVDPNGERTTGIERRSTEIENIGTSFQNKRRIAYSDEGGLDAWDTDSYLNIWVGELEAIFGEATRPTLIVNPEEDGVFIDPVYFGFFCSDVNDFYLGRTLTHEVGHYFNLLHIWGDVADCDYDDLVEDTPLQLGPNHDCPIYPKASTCDSGAVNELTNNYMDYVNDECMAMFTIGQKMRMRAALELFRSGLLTSKGCDLMQANQGKTSLKEDIVNVFPNPANNCIHVDLGIDADLQIRMEMINAAGQRIFSNQLDVKDLRAFDISSYPDGVYFLLFENGNNFVSKKLIIDK